jgi:hypothetical protein
MNHFRKALSLLLLTVAVCYVQEAWPQDNLNLNLESRAGVLVPDFSKLPDLPRQQFVYVPTGGLPLFEAQQKQVATLSKFCPVGKYTDGHMRMFTLPLSNPNNCVNVPLEKLHHYSDDTYVIPFFENDTKVLRLFDGNSLGSTWAKVSDIIERNFVVMSWKDYFISRRTSPILAKGRGLNLRESPYADARRILTVKGERMHMFITGYDDGFCEGPWCKVKVKIYKENPCTTQSTEEANVESEYEGWVKLIDDAGLPNVYMNTKGC